MKAITQRESVVTYIKSCLIFQIPRFVLISKYCVISPLKSFHMAFLKSLHMTSRKRQNLQDNRCVRTEYLKNLILI